VFWPREREALGVAVVRAPSGAAWGQSVVGSVEETEEDGSIMRWMTRAAGTAVIAALALVGLGLGIDAALASAPEPWQLGFQPPGSPLKSQLEHLHNWLLVIITIITIFVMVLLIYTMVRFRASRNPVPSRNSHNTLLEVAWTLIPVLILVGVFIPSFKLLKFIDRTTDAEMTLKVTGHQWYWSYEYPEQGELKFDSYIIQEADLKPGQKRLLEVDNRIVLPVDTNVRILIAGSDVIHSFFVPSLALQVYSMPGRLNEMWVRIDKPGVYYGQCNQICGVNHAYMPIAVEAVSKADYAKWLVEAKKKFAATGAEPVAVAAVSGSETR
jgi:cytochrome c oxidase subunit 2